VNNVLHYCDKIIVEKTHTEAAIYRCDVCVPDCMESALQERFRQVQLLLLLFLYCTQ
jgi:hypothetical protein